MTHTINSPSLGRPSRAPNVRQVAVTAFSTA